MSVQPYTNYILRRLIPFSHFLRELSIKSYPSLPTMSVLSLRISYYYSTRSKHNSLHPTFNPRISCSSSITSFLMKKSTTTDSPSPSLLRRLCHRLFCRDVTCVHYLKRLAARVPPSTTTPDPWPEVEEYPRVSHVECVVAFAPLDPAIARELPSASRMATSERVLGESANDSRSRGSRSRLSQGRFEID